SSGSLQSPKVSLILDLRAAMSANRMSSTERSSFDGGVLISPGSRRVSSTAVAGPRRPLLAALGVSAALAGVDPDGAGGDGAGRGRDAAGEGAGLGARPCRAAPGGGKRGRRSRRGRDTAGRLSGRRGVRRRPGVASGRRPPRLELRPAAAGGARRRGRNVS